MTINKSGRYTIVKSNRKSIKIDVVEAMLLKIEAARKLIRKTGVIPFRSGSPYEARASVYFNEYDSGMLSEAISVPIVICAPTNKYKGNAHCLIKVNEVVDGFFCKINPPLPYSLKSKIFLHDMLHFDAADMRLLMNMHVHLISGARLTERMIGKHLTLNELKAVIVEEHISNLEFIFSNSTNLFSIVANKVRSVGMDWVQDQWQI